MSSAFTAMNFDSVEGRRLKAIIEERLEEARVKLEDVNLSERDTQATRGSIRELRNLLRGSAHHVSAPRYSGPPKPFTKPE